MQKKYKILTLTLASFLLAGCTNGSNHTHDFGSEWSKNSEGHYHICTGKDCNEKSAIEEHDYNDWVVDAEPSENQDGLKTRTCKVCGYVEEEVIPYENTHTHTYSNQYSYDENGHWKVCTGEGCNEKDPNSIGNHTFGSWSTTAEATVTTAGEKQRTCTVCTYVQKEVIPATGETHKHTFNTSVWSYDSNTHWHAATCEHTDIKNSESYHTMGSWTVTKQPTESEAGSKTRKCKTCAYNEVESIPATGPVSNSFVITTDLTTEKEIHTSEQKTYLSYDGEYATMDPNNYPDGKSHRSDSLAVDLAWNFTPASGKTVKNYSVTFGQDANLQGAYEVTGTTAKSIKLYNTFLGTNYFKITANYTDNTKEFSAINSFKVSEIGPRNLTIDSLTNCRDMGGRTTVAGAKIKQGLLYRTCGNKYNGSNMSDAGKATMINQLGLKTEINVADRDGYNINLNGSTVYNAFMDYAKQNGVSKHHFSRNAESVKNVFKLLSDENNYPAYFHCRIGTDRTGLVGNLVLGLLGVPLNMIYQDYLFSNFGAIGEKRYIGKADDQDDISVYMNEINSMPGANFQEKTYNTLLSIGVTKDTLDKVIDLLTDGPKANNDKGQIAVSAHKMNVSGTSTTYTPRSNITDRKEPEYYIKLSNNASASYTIDVTIGGSAQFYAYLGHNDFSSSKKLQDSIKVEIDGNAISVPNKTFQDIGMGNIDGRTNYYFVKIGEASNLSVGSHTIKITGISNDMKFSTFSIFGIEGSGVPGQGENTDNPGGNEDEPPVVGDGIVFNVANASGYNNSGNKFNGKTSSDNYATWNVGDKLPAGDYKVTITCMMTDNSHSDRKWYNMAKPALCENGVAEETKTDHPDSTSEDDYRYYIQIGSEIFNPTNRKSWKENNMSKSSFVEVEFISSMTIPANITSFTLYHGNIGYSLKVQSITFYAIA